MDLKNFPYKTSFSSEITCLVSKETDYALATASLQNLKFLIPQNFIDQQSIDLIAFSFNGAVVNRRNKNGDAISTAEALSIYQKFIHRPLDIEHHPQEICGHLINAGFTYFGTDKEMSESIASQTNDPFNMALAAYFYARNFTDLAEAIEEAADPESLKFRTISASWELLFKQYKIMVGGKNLSEARVVEDPKEAKALESLLISNKGSGQDKSGNYIYRLITGEVYPSGFGITKKPAADVRGIYVPGITDKELKEQSQASEKKCENNENNFSKTIKHNVNKTDMKLSTIDDIKKLSAEDFQKITASDLTDLLEKEIAKESEKVVASQKEKSTATETQLGTLQEQLNRVLAAQESQNHNILFNTRMNALDEAFALDNDHRKIVAKQIRGLSEEDFTSWRTDFEILIARKVNPDSGDPKDKDVSNPDKSKAEKKDKKDAKDDDKDDKDDKSDAKKAKADDIEDDQSDSSKKDDKKDDKKEAMASAARTFLDGLKPSNASVIPNTVSTGETLVQKYQGAFTRDTVSVKIRR